MHGPPRRILTSLDEDRYEQEVGEAFLTGNARRCG
jgi:hypothetical protein